jgi:UDP:flavonoid glycosyltransferase YjiC (YdhE family)
VTWAGGGNVNPLLGLAEQLQARGHRLGAVAGSSLGPRLTGSGIEVVAVVDGWLPGAQPVAEAIAAYRPDALVVDYQLTGALSAGEASGLPTVALVHTLYTALLVDGAPHPMSMAGPIGTVNEARSSMGLPPVTGYADLLAASDLVLVAAPRELDLPGPVPANVAYAGALFEGPGPDGAWQPPPGRGPLVAVSVGTAGEAGPEAAMLARIVEALIDLPVRAVINLPGYLEPSCVPPARNVVVTGYLRHAATLPHVDALVTHAGLGSVVAALAHGVPMVCLPLGREQPENAAAVGRLGAGCVLGPEASVAEIRDAIIGQLDRQSRVTLPPAPGLVADRLETLLTAGRG